LPRTSSTFPVSSSQVEARRAHQDASLHAIVAIALEFVNVFSFEPEKVALLWLVTFITNVAAEQGTYVGDCHDVCTPVLKHSMCGVFRIENGSHRVDSTVELVRREIRVGSNAALFGFDNDGIGANDGRVILVVSAIQNLPNNEPETKQYSMRFRTHDAILSTSCMLQVSK
jgi:hypothetical protein